MAEGAAVDADSLDRLERYVRHIAFTLHDGPAQSMGMASAMIDNALRQDDPRTARALLRRSQGLVDRSLRDLRDVFSELRPSALDDGSLTEQVAEYVSECRDLYGVPVALEVRGTEPDLSARSRTLAFRIVQEALTNVRRHSHCTRAAACLEYDDEGVTVMVRDDGRGFDILDPSVPGWGLRGIAERARAAGGYADILSAPGAGTFVIAGVPKEVAW